MIKLNDIYKSYGDKIIFNQFNLELPENKITCILGKSGAGKTTILNMIAGLTNYQGTILCENKIAYIFQEPRLIQSRTVEDNLKFVVPDAKAEEIDYLLKEFDILDKKTLFSKRVKRRRSPKGVNCSSIFVRCPSHFDG